MAKLTVRVQRDDGSVTFKGWYGDRTDAAERERDAWVSEGWTARVVDGSAPDAGAELKEWKEATKDDGRYFPRVDA